MQQGYADKKDILSEFRLTQTVSVLEFVDDFRMDINFIRVDRSVEFPNRTYKFLDRNVRLFTPTERALQRCPVDLPVRPPR